MTSILWMTLHTKCGNTTLILQRCLKVSVSVYSTFININFVNNLFDLESDKSSSPSLPEDLPSVTSPSQEITSVTDERSHVDSIARIMAGPPVCDEDFDTDIEEDFAPGNKTSILVGNG